MERIITDVAVQDDTSKEHIIKAILELEESHKVNVLKFFVAKNHRFIMVDFDGLSVTKWIGNVEDFIKKPSYTNLTVADIF